MLSYWSLVVEGKIAGGAAQANVDLTVGWVVPGKRERRASDSGLKREAGRIFQGPVS